MPQLTISMISSYHMTIFQDGGHYSRCNGNIIDPTSKLKTSAWPWNSGFGIGRSWPWCVLGSTALASTFWPWLHHWITICNESQNFSRTYYKKTQKFLCVLELLMIGCGFDADPSPWPYKGTRVKPYTVTQSMSPDSTATAPQDSCAVKLWFDRPN